MSDKIFEALVRWDRNGDSFLGQEYSRGHKWVFDHGVTVPASASPHSVKAPWSVEAAVDPEEGLAAVVSSCHMLFFLAFASREGFIVESYEDRAAAKMERGANGKVSISTVYLRPQVVFSGSVPSSELFSKLHHEAHEACYIANSLNGSIVVEPVISSQDR